MTSGEDKEHETVELIFIASKISVSYSQYRRAINYINEYNGAIRQLREVSRYLQRNFNNDLNMSNVQRFLSNITTSLTTNVQQLTVKYSPDTIRNYIVYFYQSFWDNLSSNNDAQAEIRELNLLYFKNLLNPNASSCIDENDRKYNFMFSSAASNFTEMMEREIYATVGQLESLRAEIRAMVINIVNTLSSIISNRVSARQQFDEYVRSISFTI